MADEDTRAEVDSTPAKEARRWLLEIRLADKRERDWRKTARDILNRYRGKDRKKNSFNILWANTEVLRPALYNSTPKPDVRRRFRQNDALGKAVAEVAERGISYCVDAYDADNYIGNDVLDALLPGRGLSRVRYVPSIKQVEGEAFDGKREEVEYEQALCEHVQWDDFLHGPGKTWEEVQWNAFRCKFSRDELREKFGKRIGDKITLDDTKEPEVESERNSTELKEVFKRAELWEVWDKEGKDGKGRVFFVNESYREGLIFPKSKEDGEDDGKDGTPPIKFKNFFPVPRPLQLVEDTGSLLPIPLYELYREQADELDRLSTRINRVINALKVRGVYDSTLSELSELMKGDDNALIPAEQARAWMTNGGLEKAIWWMPIEQSAKVLRELYVARDTCKQVIFEITGLSDILRGATDPNETLGAQKLKANSSSLRLQRMQREVQRYTRDLIRLLAEVIGEHFSQETLAQMTGLQFPTAVMKQQAQLQLQAAQAQAVPQQPGQPPAAPPPPDPNVQKMLSMPTWEDIMGVLRSDMQREYRVDIETDSTIAQSLQQDMEGLKEVVGGIVEFWQGVGPAVQAGAVSIEAVKAITMSIVRRARMGLEVEDALEAGLQQPKPQAVEQQAQNHALEVAQIKADSDKQKMMAEDKAKQAVLTAEIQVEDAKQKHEQQMASIEAERDKALAEMEARYKDSFERWKVEEDNKTKIEIANIGKAATLEKSDKDASAQADQFERESKHALDVDLSAKDADGEKTKPRPIDRIAEMHGQTTIALQELTKAMTKARGAKVLRGPDGKMSGIEAVQ